MQTSAVLVSGLTPQWPRNAFHMTSIVLNLLQFKGPDWAFPRAPRRISGEGQTRRLARLATETTGVLLRTCNLLLQRLLFQWLHGSAPAVAPPIPEAPPLCAAPPLLRGSAPSLRRRPLSVAPPSLALSPRNKPEPRLNLNPQLSHSTLPEHSHHSRQLW